MNDKDAEWLLTYSGTDDPAPLLAIYRDRHVNMHLRVEALNHPAVSDDQVLDILHKASRDRRSAIVCWCTRPEVLRRWEPHASAKDRPVIAFNPETPADVVNRMVDDPDPVVRSSACFHPDVPEAVVERLMREDQSADVREAAENALTTEFGQTLREGERWATLDPGPPV